MTDAPVENHPCDQCGQLDDHPMIHTYAGESFHFDCLPHRHVELLGDLPQHAVTLAGIEAAKSGVHGDDLREFLFAQPTDNDVEPEGHEPVVAGVAVIHTLEG